jgi:hypothetical protein
MRKFKNVANFKSKFLTAEDGSVYVRFDYGGFYEWYQRAGESLLLLDVEASKELERSLEDYQPPEKPKVIFLGDIRLKSNMYSAASE